MRFLLLIFLASLFTTSVPEERIAWSPTNRLTWADFKALPDYEVPWAATTSSGISFGFSGNIKGGEVTYTAEVECYFYPTNSWYKKELATEHLLAHEQIHFDISEIHARKLRRRIASFDFTEDLRNEMNGLYEMTNAEMKQMQEQYDQETKFSLDQAAQERWAYLVEIRLKALKAYRSE